MVVCNASRSGLYARGAVNEKIAFVATPEADRGTAVCVEGSVSVAGCQGRSSHGHGRGRMSVWNTPFPWPGR